MRKIIRKIFTWAMNNTEDRPILAAETSRNDSTPSMRIGILKAMNGKVLEISTYKHNPHGPDWTSEMFIVPEDQTLTQALTTLLVMKGIQ